MRILLAAMYLLLDAARSFLVFHAGRGRRRAPHPARVSTPSRRYESVSTVRWARAADDAAIAELLRTRPGAVGRVAVR